MVIKKLFKLLKFFVKTLLNKAFLYYYIFTRKLKPISVSENEAIIVSLTTYYKRFDVVYITLESIFHQAGNIKYEIHLYLSQDDIDRYGGCLPQSIINLKKYGLQIFIKDENIFSYKKYFYVLKANPDKTIITADDDIRYPPYWLESLLNKSYAEPNCIVCFRGHFLNFTKEGKLSSYESILDCDADNSRRDKPSYALLPTGVSGVLYPPHSLDEIALNKTMFTKLSPNGDDIWLKMASLLSNTMCVQVLNKNIHFPLTILADGINNEALSMDNIVSGKNDEQIEACFAYFPELLMKVKSDVVKK